MGGSALAMAPWSHDHDASSTSDWFAVEAARCVVGLVEPIRTEQPHQGKGLSRHVVASAIHKLVDAGSERIKVSYESDNTAAVTPYLGSGFEPTMTCSLWSTTTT